MKITTGILLILTAILNLFASLGYLLGGALFAGTSTLADEMMEHSDTSTMTAEEQAAMADVISTTGAGGSGLLLFSLFLLVSVGILIAGAVFLFKNSNPTFIKIAGGVALLAEIVGILIISFGIMNVVGLVAGALALIIAFQMGPKVEESIEPAA